MLLVILALLSACVVALFGVLLAWSPGTAEPFLDANGEPLPSSLSEKIRVRINGVEQGMFIRGKDRTKPVLLFVHGGPAMPEYAIARRHPTVLEDHFVVCWWDQRGAGLSYRSDRPPETITPEQLIADTLEVARYLRQRFGQEKVYLLAHSWGSFLGLQAVAREPGLFHAYIGMGQVTQQLESEKRAWKHMVERYQADGNAQMVERLRKFPMPELAEVPRDYLGLRDQAMHELGIGTTRAMRSVVTGVFVPVWRHREYTLGEKLALWRGKWSEPSRRMFDGLMATDLTAVVTRVEVPVHLVQGTFDYTSSYTLAKEYFAKLQAPVKGFYSFEQSAHSPLFEEPEKMRRILVEDVLARTARLADPI
ncbi:MAG: alpha/beta hydrolase [Myxococcales bacterium]